MSGSGAEQRAEISPQNSSPIRRHEGRHGTAFQRFKVDVLVIADGSLQWLPRPSWKVAPAIGIGLATPAGMAILENFSGRTALVQAAGCENPIVALNFMYAQDVRKNPDSLTITNESFVITMDLPATFGPAEVLYKKNPDDPKETPKFYPLQLEMRRDHASGKTVVKEQPNKGNSLYLEYTFLDDAKDPKTGFTPRRPLVLTCNEAGYFVGGRASTPDTLNRVVNNPSITGLSKVGDRSFELVSAFMKVYKRRPAFTPPGAKSDENLKALKASVAEAIASYKRIKAEEAKRFGVDAAQKVAVTGVVTPTATSRVTAAATSTYTEEVQAALEKVMGDRLDKAISPLQKDLQGTSDTLRDVRNSLREQTDTFDRLSQRIKALEGTQEEAKKEFAEIKGRLVITATMPTTLTVPAAGGVEIGSTLDWPAKLLDQVTEPDAGQPIRTGVDILGWLTAFGLLFDRPFRPRTRVRNALAWPVREVRYSLGPLRAHNEGLATGAIEPGTPAPARGYPGPLGV